MIGVLVTKRAMADAFEAMNRHDLPKFMSGWRDDAVFIFSGEVPASGTFQGKSAIESWFRNFFDQFPRIQFDVQDICVKNIFDLTGNNSVAVHWNLNLTNRDGREGKNSGVSVFTIKGGKVVRLKDFIFDQGQEFRLNWGVA
jgi:ketosteroid isomerase-like protein